MLVLRCTTKAFKKIGLAPRRVDISDNPSTFGEWCVHTVDLFNDGHLLACMHTESLYVLFVCLQPPVSGDQLVTGLQSRLLKRLMELETPPDVARRVLEPYRDKAILAKTNDRRTTGLMNAVMQDVEYLLADESSGLWDGNRLLGPKLEHRLNTTPRGTSSSKVTIWPLPAFWECVRKWCPELPRRATLRLFFPDNRAHLQQIGKVLYDHLPEHLAGKLIATLQEVDVLYSADELQTLADAMDERPELQDSLISKYNDGVRRQVTVKLERLLGLRD